MLLQLFAYMSFFLAVSCSLPGCIPRDYGHGSPVCVCNSTYCDIVEPTTSDQLTIGVVKHYVSTKTGKRLQPMTMKFSQSSINQKEDAVSFTVNRNTRYQEMFGFGGAATDAATINTYSLSSGAAEKLIRSYFSEDGIGYTFIRVPLGGSDFSTHYYEYTDDYSNDISLNHFNLSIEDYQYKIPFIKQAKNVSRSEVKLFTAAWSAPAWMKIINTPLNTSHLKEEYYQLYADYTVKFLDFYAAQGLDFWGMTPQNEPSHGITYSYFNSMGWYPEQMRNYLVSSLCPTLKSRGYSGLKLMINDDQRSDVEKWSELYKNTSIKECVSGMALHWYQDDNVSASVLSTVHKNHPDKFLLYTEACVMQYPVNDGHPVLLGSWERGAKYMTDIVDVVNHWVTGWVDWNMALDANGGPNWVNNFVDSPVIVNTTADEFYKQPMFYALAHFSKFVPPGSVHIGLETKNDGDIENVAFLTPDNTTVVIMQNNNDKEKTVVINDQDRGSVSLEVPAHSMHTVLYK